MLKNKIYKYLANEIIKNFITVLLTFSAIAWTVRSVNFLDLMIEDGYSSIIYFKYSFLNFFTIVSRFIPLSFLLSLVISIAKFERQQELLILWTTGVNRMKIANIFFFISFLIVFFQIILSLFINPFTLNKSRALLRETENKDIFSMIKSSDFSDSIKGVTFYINEKKSNNELVDLFIKDNNGSLGTIVSEIDNSNNTTIFAKKGFIEKNKLILFNGSFQSLNTQNEIKNVFFQKTELNIKNFDNRTIKEPKIQETSSIILLKCIMQKEFSQNLQNCSSDKSKKNIIEALSRRIGMPLYIPLISIIASFLLIYKKEKKYNFIKQYIIFGLGFLILIFAEVLVRFSGFSTANFIIYISTPLILFIIAYFILFKKLNIKKY